MASLASTSSLAAESDGGSALRQRADALMADGKPDEAIPLLDDLVRAAPDDGAAFGARGLARWRTLNAPAGKDGFAWLQRQRCMGVGPSCTELAGVLDDLGRAVTLSAGGTRASVLMTRAEIRLALGAPALALRDEDEAVALVPDDPAYRERRASARDKLGDSAGALADLDRAVALRPGDTQPILLRAMLRSDAGDLKGSLADLDEAVRLSGGDGEIMATRAETRRRSGDLAGARADLDAAVRLVPIGDQPPWVAEARALRRAIALPDEPGMGATVRDLRVAHVEAVDDGAGRPALSVTFDPGSAKRLGDFTAAHLGGEVQMILNSEVILSARISNPITGGIVNITGSSTSEALTALAAKLRLPGADLMLKAN